MYFAICGRNICVWQWRHNLVPAHAFLPTSQTHIEYKVLNLFLHMCILTNVFALLYRTVSSIKNRTDLYDNMARHVTSLTIFSCNSLDLYWKCDTYPKSINESIHYWTCQIWQSSQRNCSTFIEDTVLYRRDIYMRFFWACYKSNTVLRQIVSLQLNQNLDMSNRSIYIYVLTKDQVTKMRHYSKEYTCWKSS